MVHKLPSPTKRNSARSSLDISVLLCYHRHIHNIGFVAPFLPLYDHFEIRRVLFDLALHCVISCTSLKTIFLLKFFRSFADHSLPLVGSSWMVVKALDGKRGWCGVLGIYVAIWKPICSIYLPSCASWASLPIFTPPCNQAEGWINIHILSGQFYQHLQNKEVRDLYYFPSVNPFDVFF